MIALDQIALVYVQLRPGSTLRPRVSISSLS